ncbi:hypothetical protein CRENPOLYSF1_330033 [Crenothrix polyspora]|uniref:Uncharacterized protein n=1 Tax=Crenothrix polyspora TaxID=360316 RepID=A0A1R4H977_9GAMM|nr:hypothetical protein CRENPOLYSF1_330033 [Crenothrix polyspora]
MAEKSLPTYDGISVRPELVEGLVVHGSTSSPRTVLFKVVPF